MRNLCSWLLAALGVVQLAGSALGLDVLRDFGWSSVASPAPIGFSHRGGREPFALRLELETVAADGRRTRRPLDASSYDTFGHPLARRYVYTRALHYPLLHDAPEESKAARFALCDGGPVARALALDGDAVAFVVHGRTRTRGEDGALSTVVRCAP